MVDFGALGVSRGLYAPAISYHDGRFWIVNTCVDCGGNFVITATDPAGPWSDPVWLKEAAGGIDPSLFFDDDGSAWRVNNDVPAKIGRASCRERGCQSGLITVVAVSFKKNKTKHT